MCDLFTKPVYMKTEGKAIHIMIWCHVFCCFKPLYNFPGSTLEDGESEQIGESQCLEPDQLSPHDRLHYSRSKSGNDLVAMSPTESHQYASTLPQDTVQVSVFKLISMFNNTVNLMHMKSILYMSHLSSFLHRDIYWKNPKSSWQTAQTVSPHFD